MKTLLAAAAMLLGLATTAVAHDRIYYAYTFAPTNHVIHVSCYRGPWQQVIWDRPEPIFLDSLTAVGYDYATAESIANRICRDQSLVGNKAGLRNEMLRIYYGSTAYRRYGY